MTRKIIHVDMDAFYASVEQRDAPELRGRPVVVGGSPQSRGVVAAASYEARKYGVRSAMPCARAARLCPDAVFVPPDFAKYKDVSRRIQRIFREVTDLVEPLSLDEAFLDVSDAPSATRVARGLKRAIADATGLTASAGVGPSKLVAKLASDLDKPNGLVVVRPEEVDAFLVQLPARRLWGVGPKTAERLDALGIGSVSDIRAKAALIRERFGRWGGVMVDMAHGKDDRPVVSSRPAKSRGAETTLARDLRDRAELERIVRRQADRVSESLTSRGHHGRTVTLKVRYANFETITRSFSPPEPVQTSEEIARVALHLLGHTEAGARPVRLVGVSVGGLEPAARRQLRLL